MKDPKETLKNQDKLGDWRGTPVPMPVVPRIGAYVFFFYSLENNEPPHIHIRRDRAQAKFWLVPVSLAYNGGSPLHEVRQLSRLVKEHREVLLRSWHDYFKSAND